MDYKEIQTVIAEMQVGSKIVLSFDEFKSVFNLLPWRRAGLEDVMLSNGGRVFSCTETPVSGGKSVYHFIRATGIDLVNDQLSFIKVVAKRET